MGEAKGSGGSAGKLIRSLLPTIMFSIVVPLVVFNVAKSHGASDLKAYLLAAIGPIVETVVVLVTQRVWDKVSLFMAALNLGAAALVGVGSTTPTFLLIKDSAMTGVFGVICLLSLFATPRPLMFYFAQRFNRGGTPGAAAEFDRLWETTPGFRRGFQVMTAVWGVGMVAEAVIRVIIAETVSFQAAYNLNQFLPLVVMGGLAALSAWYSMRMKAQGQRKRATEGVVTQG